MAQADAKGLTAKQLRFVSEYLIDSNATQAAIRAGYSPKTAEQQGYRLLTKVQVKEAVAAHTSKILNNLEVTAERVLKERARLAFLDPRKFFDAKGKPLSIHELDDDTAAAVAGFEFETVKVGKRMETRLARMKITGKDPSLTALEKHLGLYKDDTGAAPPFNIHIHLGD